VMRGAIRWMDTVACVAAAVLMTGFLGVTGFIGEPRHAAAAIVTVPQTPDYGSAIEPLAGYDARRSCTTATRPGTAALRDAIQRTYPQHSLMNTSRGCSANDDHSDGRAIDWSLTASHPDDAAVASAFLSWLLATDRYGNAYAMARRMGVMYIIWNQKMWRAYDTGRGWAPYNGVSPHTDHIHLSLSWDGANGKTSFTTAAVAGCIANSVGCPVSRLSGADRYASSVAIGRASFPLSTTVVIASGAIDQAIEGLIAAPFAYSMAAPLLLTATTKLPAVISADLVSRSTETVYLIGTPSSISVAVEDGLRADGYAVTRIAGVTPTDTAAEVAIRMGGPREAAVIAAGWFPDPVDAMSVGGPSAKLGMPILLTNRDVLPAATRDALLTLGVRTPYVVGGAGVVSDEVFGELGGAAIRLAGPDRYATSVAIAGAFAARVGAVNTVVANGANNTFSDSVPAGVLGQLVVLTTPSTLATPAATWIHDTGSLASATVVGGPAVITDSVAQRIAVALRH
jgi:putative cell wall-binding protein